MISANKDAIVHSVSTGKVVYEGQYRGMGRVIYVESANGYIYIYGGNEAKLAEIYSEINKMEKARTTIDSFPVYKELFMRYALLALACLLLELLLRLFFRRLP